MWGRLYYADFNSTLCKKLLLAVIFQMDLDVRRKMSQKIVLIFVTLLSLSDTLIHIQYTFFELTNMVCCGLTGKQKIGDGRAEKVCQKWKKKIIGYNAFSVLCEGGIHCSYLVCGNPPKCNFYMAKKMQWIGKLLLELLLAAKNVIFRSVSELRLHSRILLGLTAPSAPRTHTF